MTNDSLEVRWLEGDEAAAGLLTAGMTAAELRAFGTEALAVCCGKVDVPPAVFDVVKVGRDDPSRGHAAFDAVRQLELRSGMQRQSAASQLLCVAEHVARVIYNSTAPDDPFDADADEYMFKSMAAFCMSLKPDTRGRALARTLPRSHVDSTERHLDRRNGGDPGEQVGNAVVRRRSGSMQNAGGRPDGRTVEVVRRRCFDGVLRSRGSRPRVIYNSIGPDDPFDHAAKEWLFQTTASFYYASPNDVRRKLGGRLLQALPCATGNKAPRSQTS